MPERVVHIVPDDEMGGGAVIVAHLLRAAPAGGPPQLALLPRNADAALRALFRDLPHEIARFRGRGAVLEMAGAIRACTRPGDLVHTHGARAAAAALLARGLGRRRRIVYTVHGFHGLAEPGRLLGLRRGLERVLARCVDATAFVSAADAALARRAGLRYRGTAEVIENGVAEPSVEGAGGRDVDVLFVGRLVTQKNPEAFVETVGRLPPGFRAVMIGDGEKAQQVDARIAERNGRPERLAALPHPEVLRWMARARLLVMTSRWEGLPTVAIEALMSGALPVGFAIPPLAEVLGDAAGSCLTPPEPAALAARVADLLADEPRRAALAAAAGEAARRRYSTRRMAADYAALYARAEA